jgi:uncharacterized protein
MLAAREARPIGPPIMRQRWEHLVLLHWIVSPGEIQRTLPDGLTVDAYFGAAYVAITACFVRNVRPIGLPTLYWLSEFQQLGVRTYVKDASGLPGIWFYSLDCDQPLAASAARFWNGLPYHSADMTTSNGTAIDFSSRRRRTEGCAHYRYRATGPEWPTAPASLEFHLLERYHLFSRSRAGGKLLCTRMKHSPCRYRKAKVERWSALPAQLDGLEMLRKHPDHACIVEGLDLEVYGVTRAG